MAGHAYVSQVGDHAAQKALLDVQGQIARLSARVQALEQSALQTRTALNANGQPIQNVGDGQTDNDAATVRQLKKAVKEQVETF